MRIWKYKYFVPLISTLFIGLASYAIISLVLNSWALDIGFFPGTWPLSERCGIIVLMVTEVLFLVATLIGLAAVFCRNIVVWYIPGFVLLLSGVTLLAFGSVTLRDSRKDLTFDLFRAFQKVNGTKSELYLNWISDVQWENDCCGIVSYKDYLQFNLTSLPSGSVPNTCCERKSRIPAPNCGYGVLAPGKAIEEVEAVLSTQGCGQVMSRAQGLKLRKLGTEMLILGLLSVAFAIFMYIGIFKIVAAEYAQLAQAEESENAEAGADLSQAAISSTTAANTSANSAIGVERNSANRRIFRTRRHGGGESIVSFAVDLENNNVGGPTPMSRGHRVSTPRKGQGLAKGRTRTPPVGRVSKVKGQIAKGQGHRHVNPKLADQGFLKTSKEQLEMLLKPRDNHSILSTTPYSSTHNFISYFRQGQAQGSKVKVTDSDPKLGGSKCQKRNQPLTHYSSLPHVQTPVTSASVIEVDPKETVMAELRKRFPPTLPPPVSSQTQHHHYYRIPSGATSPTESSAEALPATLANASEAPNFIDRKFPSRILAESTLATIQEEGESAASTLIQTAPTDRVSIFEVFSHVMEGNEADDLDLTSGDVMGSEQVNGSEESLDEILNSAQAPSSILVIKEDTEGMDDGIANSDDMSHRKIDAEPMDALVYFQV